MASVPTAVSIEPPFDQLADLKEDRLRCEFFRKRPRLRSAATVTRLYDECIRLLRVDLRRAECLIGSAAWLALELRDECLVGKTSRAMGHVLNLRANYRPALEKYEEALRLFERAGQEMEWALTVSGMLQTLIYLGSYDRAFQLAEKARDIYLRNDDHLRLARLDSNMGNVFYRQDRFEQAFALYQRAHRAFAGHGDPTDVAVALHNMAVCSISLNHFDQALTIYQDARGYSEQHGLPALVAEADYNIAYLYYLRGEYTTAISLYEKTRELCARVADPYHSALCDLDQAEMYLELNLSEGGARLARRAFSGFRDLKMNYEAAKALTFLAIAASHRGRAGHALRTFDEARALFIRERNELWPALIYLYKAVVLFEAGQYSESERLAASALAYFDASPLVGKAATCELQLARVHLQRGDTVQAAAYCEAALKRIEEGNFPAVSYHAYFLLGAVREAQGDPQAAIAAYTRAHSLLEELRSQLRGEELKIAFLKNKLAVYENLVSLSLQLDPAGAGPRVFDLIERAKSRSLADLIAFRARGLRPRSGGAGAAGDKLRDLREKINYASHQIESEGWRVRHESEQRITRLRREIRSYEDELAAILGKLHEADHEFVDVQGAVAVGLDAIQAALPDDATLVEYYQARGKLLVCLVSRSHLEIVQLGSIEKVRDQLRLLQFQLAKFRFGPGYIKTFGDALFRATDFHLKKLYDVLISPIRDRIRTRHLVVVPHGFLHYLPFHALHDGFSYLGDTHTISYAPSASVLTLCCTKKGVWNDESLVLGVPDRLAPHILEEVRSVSEHLPKPRVFVGSDATEERLREFGPSSRFVHIATHGLFRSDSPMFSSIRLGRSLLNLYDLYRLELSCELVTLSGCGTGLNVVVGGDELLGLVRGLLYAGSQAVMVTLWDVNDESTARFMKSFYVALKSQPDKALALQEAIREVRDANPHPYYWAPFALIGKYRSDL